MKTLMIFTMVLLTAAVSAQVTSSTDFIKGGQHDAQQIISAYLLPIERALCFDGANNTIIYYKHKEDSDIQFGFGINFTTSFINSNDFTYDVNDLDLEDFELVDPQQHIAQTAAGDESSILLQTKDKYYIATSSYPYFTEKPILTLSTPEGTNSTFLPFPYLHFFAQRQGNIVDFKFLPPLKIKNSTLGLFDIGISVQHNLETSLKFLSDMWFDIYISAGFNYNRIIYYLDIKPDDDQFTFSVESDNGPYDNQEFQIHTTSIPLKISFVKQLNNFSFSLGGGYNANTSIVKMVGNYPVYSSDPSNQFQIIATDIKDPIDYFETFNKFSADASVSFQTKHFSVGAKYTYSYYKSLNLSFAYAIL